MKTKKSVFQNEDTLAIRNVHKSTGKARRTPQNGLRDTQVVNNENHELHVNLSKCDTILSESEKFLDTLTEKFKEHANTVRSRKDNPIVRLSELDFFQNQLSNEIETFLKNAFDFIDDNLNLLGDKDFRKFFVSYFKIISGVMGSYKIFIKMEQYTTFINSIKPEILWILKYRTTIEWK